jgi:predicted ATPase/class 3 adenylate cyclase
MPDLPGGTVTFLFSDIEGSTKLLQEHGTRYGSFLARHRELLRGAFGAGGGIEVGTEGDSFFVVFPTAIGAVTAAVAGQRALQAEPWTDGTTIRVRMGLVTGEAELTEQGYVGLDVHRAARLSAAGHGGQVLVSDETRTAVEGALPAPVTLRELGEHRLKDIEAPERIHQVVADGLPDDFPAPRTLSVAAVDLPEPISSFLGREAEISEVVALLEHARLVTLTGPGGVGKTRLGIEVGRRMIGRFRDGITFVPLAPIREVELVIPTIAGRVGMADRGGREPLARLTEHLHDRHLLLVLDNLEHLLPAAQEIASLLEGALHVSVLATSRSPLALYGERQFPVPALPLPPDTPRTPASPEAFAGFEAVMLFVERAAAISPTFALTEANATSVAELARRLDGLPLAIELAAARVNVLTPEAILARLDDRLSLGGSARDLPERQQTLRAAIGWSYALLDAEARDLFTGLSVFVGGAGLQAAEHVLGGDARADILDGLARLVDASLLRSSQAVDEPRFTMLETIHAYAFERLGESGRADALRERHAAYYAGLAARAKTEVLGSDAGMWLDRLEREHDNLRAVMTRAIEHADASLALRFGADLWRFWQRRGYLVEGLRRVLAALQLPVAVDPALRADALEAAGGLAYWQADASTTRDMYEQVLAIRREQDDPAAVAEALYNLSFSHTWLSLSDSAAKPDPDAALRLLEEALDIFERAGDRSGVAKTLWGIGTSEFWMQRLPEAKLHTNQSLVLARELEDAFLTPWVLYLDAVVELALGELDRVAPSLGEALVTFQQANDVSAYALVLDAFAALAVRAGDRERAARVSGAVAELEARSGTGLNRINRAVIGFDPTELRTDPTLAEAWEEGAAMDPDELAVQLQDYRP